MFIESTIEFLRTYENKLFGLEILRHFVLNYDHMAFSMSKKDWYCSWEA